MCHEIIFMALTHLAKGNSLSVICCVPEGIPTPLYSNLIRLIKGAATSQKAFIMQLPDYCMPGM